MTLPRWAAIAAWGAVGVATALLAGVVLWAAGPQSWSTRPPRNA